jgi:hypothetical protein
MTHDDKQLPEPLRTAAHDYNKPPELTRGDLDEMWAGIEAALPAAEATDVVGTSRPRARAEARWFTTRNIVSMAATLVIGVAIGRSTTTPSILSTTEAAIASIDTLAIPEPYQQTASRYLGQTAALLATLPAEMRAGRTDDRFMGRAHDLLLTTRLLLDSPAASDPRVRTLLDDLELVLAQIVRLQTDQSRAELDLIRQALEQRDVLPRLRDAVANISADD